LKNLKIQSVSWVRAGAELRVAHGAVPGGVGVGRVLRRPDAGADGGDQGARADAAGRTAHAARLRAHDLARRGPQRLLQGHRAPVGAPDPLHHDEVRLLRAHRRAALPARGAQAAPGLLQARAAGRHLRRRLHRWAQCFKTIIRNYSRFKIRL